MFRMLKMIRMIQELSPPADTDADFIPDPKALTDTSSQNRTRIPTLAVACDRYLIRGYAGALILERTITADGHVKNVFTEKLF